MAQALSLGAGSCPLSGNDDSGSERGPLEPPSGPDSLGNSLEFHATLRRHRMSLATIRTVARLGHELRERTEQAGREFAALVEAGSGRQIGTILGGETTSADIELHLDAMRPDRPYVHLHTHPTSSSFSDLDASMLLTHAPLRAIVAIGGDGTWYVLSKSPGRRPASPARGMLAYREALYALLPKYQRLVQSGQLDDAAAWRQHTHEAWEQVAPALGLRYDRFEGR